jgi:hypothetical protein
MQKSCSVSYSNYEQNYAVTTRSKVHKFFDILNTGITGYNATRSMDVHRHLYVVLEIGLSSGPWSIKTVKSSLYLTKHHAMKAYWGSVGTALRILLPRH